ncbi:hypothetical protein SAMN04487898_106297 [Pedobacter sp. ok626]|uniref:WD40/YVTN/BNR-like repeat-containing protein n=1 Tax=Pedobacter sp. ok626 TaxID=1761882 RepID=UPI00087F1C66|nr:hypothetical protein [Pedobacter sp. ok626]SDK19916.1 hypothetical protein SAMN04487898_106297 [Pedobacter sp. ok626]
MNFNYHKIYMLILFVLLIGQACKTSAQAYQWSNVRIGGGGATINVKAHPKVPNLFFITTDVGNPYRWNNKEQKWEGLLNGIPESLWNVGACASLAIDPNDVTGNILYATVGKYGITGAAGGKVIKSADRGNTWQDAGLSLKVRSNKDQLCGDRLVVDPVNSSVVYVTSFSDGTYRGEYGGTRWKKISRLNGQFIGFDSSRGKLNGMTKTVIVGCHNGIYRSDNAGASFALMPGSPKNSRRAAFHPDGSIYVTTSTGVFKYKDSWTNISPENTSFVAVAINPAATAEVIVSTNAGKLPNFYISEDGGANWTKIIRKPDFSEVPFAEWSHFALSTFDFCWDPFNHNQVWFSDFFNAYQTADIRAKEVLWRARAVGHEEIVTLGVMVCPPSGSNELLSCTADLGGFDHPSILQPPAVSMFKFFPWVAPDLLSGNMTGVAIQETNPDFIARVGRRGWDGAGLGGWSADGGLHYEQWICPVDAKGGRIAVSAANETMIWATQNGPVYRSVNRGKTWDKVVGAPAAAVGPGNTFLYINPLAADKVNADKFYMYKGGKFYVSYNGGASFKATAASLPSVNNTSFMKIETTPGIEGDVWLSLEDKGLFHSTNSGASFSRVGAVEYSRLFACGKAAVNTPAIYVLGTVNGIKDGIFRSDDNGKTWLRIDTPAYRMGMEPNAMAADRITYGKVFVGTNGNGIYVGQPEN